MHDRILTAAIVLLLAVSAASTGVAATTAESPVVQDQHANGSAFAGTHVSFGTSSDAVLDYAVGGATVTKSISVQSKGAAEDGSGSRGGVGVDVGADLAAVTRVPAAAVSMGAKTDVSATVSSDSGAELHAHDTPHGTLVVTTGGESQYVTANLSSSAEAETAGDGRVVVETDAGTESAFVVVGDGQVTVNNAGNVSADLSENSRLVLRSYADGRDDDDAKQEELIADGTAAAEVHVMDSEGGGDLVTDVASYGGDTSVDVTEASRGRVAMTAERSRSEGTVVLTTVSERAIASTEDLSVTVDGEAAAQASSYSALRGAIGSDESRYFVRQSSNAEAGADVLVAVNEFSSRDVEMASDGGGDGSDGSTDGDGGSEGTPASGPGLGVLASLVALVAAASIARRRAG